MNNSSTTMVVGTVSKPLEVKEVTVNGETKKVGNMTICATKPGKSADGKESTKSTFYEISAWSEQQQDALGSLKKGDAVIVQGQLELQTYEKDGNRNISLKLKDAEVMPLGVSEAQGVQKIVAVGRATRDVQLEHTAAGNAHATIPMALNHSDGKTSYVDVETWGEYAEQMAKTVKRGSLLTVSGEIDLNTYSRDDGKKGASVRIVKPSVGFIQKSAAKTQTAGATAGAASSSDKGAAR